MNKKIIAYFIVAISASLSAQAQVYVGATVGASSYNLDCSNISACDTKGTALKVLAGYQATPIFGLEVSYFDLGTLSGIERGVNVKRLL